MFSMFANFFLTEHIKANLKCYVSPRSSHKSERIKSEEIEKAYAFLRGGTQNCAR